MKIKINELAAMSYRLGVLNMRCIRMLVLVVLVALAGCSAIPTPEVREDVSPETSMEDGATADVIRIGAAVSETGKYSREGRDTRQGYGTWLEWVNNEYGGIDVAGKRYQVELVMYDDEGDPDTVARLVEQLISEDRVDFLLGPYSSSLTQSASAISEKYDKIMVEGNGASESLFERGFRNLFAVLTPAGNYTQSALKMLAEQGAQSVVIAYEDTAFPTSVAEGAQRWAKAYGLEVLGLRPIRATWRMSAGSWPSSRRWSRIYSSEAATSTTPSCLSGPPRNWTSTPRRW